MTQLSAVSSVLSNMPQVALPDPCFSCMSPLYINGGKLAATALILETWLHHSLLLRLNHVGKVKLFSITVLN
jgi:hypothetical protein